MQNEITAREKLFNNRGVLANPGWARQMYYEYCPEEMAAPQERVKEWDYYFIGNQDFGVSVTINNFAMKGMLTAKLLNFKEGWHKKGNASVDGNILQPHDDCGTCYIRCAGGEAAFIRKPGIHYIRLYMPDYEDGMPLHMDLKLHVPDTDRMVIATPFKEGEKYFYFNEKLNCMRAEGTVTLGKTVYTFDPDRDFAVLDFGRGIWPGRNRWYWGSGSGELNGESFGFNLGYGFGDLSHATENMIFYKGRAHKFGSITFDIPPEGHMAGDWRIHSDDGRFDTRFTPVLDRYAPCDLSRGGSLQHQVFGRYTGTCTLDDGTVLKLQDFFGFAEDIQNNWGSNLE